MAIAVDIGGSSVRVARVGPEGISGAVARRPLDASLDGHEVAARVGAALDEVLPDADDGPVGVAFPGFPGAGGRIRLATNLPGLNGVRPDELVAGRGLPVVGVPDLAAAAVGEGRLGTGSSVERFLCVAIGTGVNAAAIAGGRVVETAFGCLGDAGHVLVEPDGPPCPCGGRGCLEAVCSGVALARDGAALGLPDGAAVVAAAREGDARAAALLERAGRGLGRAVATWSAMLFPDRVAVAGGLAAAGDLLLEPARAELARVGLPEAVRGLDLVAATLGGDATLVGAGLLALDAHRQEAHP